MQKNFDVVGKVIRIRPALKPVIEVPALFSLYQNVGNRWIRVRTTSMTAANALLVWGNEVVSDPKKYSIRPINPDYTEAK